VLVSEVITPEFDTLMDTSHDFAMFAPLRRSLRQLSVLALYANQLLFFLAEKPGVLNFFGIGEGSKALEPDVNTHLLRSFRQAFRLTLARKTDVPLASRGTMHSTRLHLPRNLPMIDHLERAYLGKRYPIIMGDTKARLWEGETIVASIALKAWVARFLFMSFDTAEEGFESQINAHGNILQDLGMDPFDTLRASH
jgi:hypothetical protein